MGEVIRRRRQELGLSQAELAGRVGTDSRAIRRYEAGDIQPSLVVAKALADALDISLDVLAGGLPLEGMSGLWWIAWKPLDQASPVQTQIEISLVGADYEALPADAKAEQRLPTSWRMTFRRARDIGLMGWFTHTKTAGVAILEPMSPGWAGRWISVPTVATPGAGHLALSRVPEDLSELLNAAINTAN